MSINMGDDSVRVTGTSRWRFPKPTRRVENCWGLDTCLCIVHTSCGEVTERTFLTGEGVKSGVLGIMFLLCNVICMSVKGGSETIIPKVV